VRRPTLKSFFTDADGEGLADRTHRRWFSEGTVPETVPVDASTTPRDVMRAARRSLAFPQPTVANLDLRGATLPTIIQQADKFIKLHHCFHLHSPSQTTATPPSPNTPSLYHNLHFDDIHDKQEQHPKNVPSYIPDGDGKQQPFPHSECSHVSAPSVNHPV
jgi:hypothetical protein